jgi:hypothetical protein
MATFILERFILTFPKLHANLTLSIIHRLKGFRSRDWESQKNYPASAPQGRVA